ncbi:unnamed protein product [Didymodactylos carnosus]|uniref:Uncharacterized protein n=1 Tax=Didymodactylos carnosus TaxID=1234261 RepID=A0A8S2D4A6_9BILA|nr:unnamed protein product [Didymodactylos carnosus]CAF3624540.1 unnamed protein product [Didymodactylos carnosus]
MKNFSLTPSDESAKSNSLSIPSSAQADSVYAAITTPVVAQTRRAHFFDRNRINLEAHQLIWCDANINDPVNQSESLITIGKLRKIVDYTKLFDNVNECLQYMEQTKDTNTFRVCSEQFVEKLASGTHELKNIKTIYIYYSKNEPHLEQWSSDYARGHRIHTNLQLLLQDITADVNTYLQQERDNIFSAAGRVNKSTVPFYATWWRSFILMLCRLPHSESCVAEFLEVLRRYYQDKDPELKTLDEFERDYTPERAIWWYTCDTFIYRLLNKALRQHNIQLMFLFGFYVKDMYKQLKNEHRNLRSRHSTDPLLKVYRGQMISVDEIKQIKEVDSPGITITSFTSTSLDRGLALVYLSTLTRPDDQLQSILFEIELDIRDQSLPFGNICHLSQFTSEDEIQYYSNTPRKTIVEEHLHREENMTVSFY